VNRQFFLLGPFVALGLMLGGPLLIAKGASPKAADDGKETTVASQDFVFLGEARPVLVRIHAHCDGKSLDEAWETFLTHLFNYLDVNGDKVLDKEEVDRVPALEMIFSGGVGRGAGFGGGGRRKGGGEATSPKLEELDTDKDGKVSRAELAAYYRKKSFIPYQFQLTPPSAPFNVASFLGGGRAEPSVEAVRKAIFTLLNTNNDGKLTKEQLAATAAILLRLDENEDEMITVKELVPDAPPANPIAGFTAMMGGPSKKGPAVNNTLLVPSPTNQSEADQLVTRLLERYGPKSAKPADKKLSRQDIGLDEATFKQLDINKDGLLDREELLAGFMKRDPDLELVLHLGKKTPTDASIEVLAMKGRPGPLADRLEIKDGLLLLDLRLTQLEMRVDDADRADQFASFGRQAILSQFKQADTDNNGWLDEKEAKASRLFDSLFKAIDRDHDGKITEKEVIAYLGDYAKIQALAKAACVTLALTDVSRGLFDLLDSDRDGRLSVREMRQAPKLLDKFDRSKKGFLTQEDVPQSFRVTVRRGPSSAGGAGQQAALVAFYSSIDGEAPAERAAAGPAWFRKMDRNRDGDVSRKEFLGSDEQFRKIDADGDGLISLEEALRFDASLRKAK
jgi:Ca2+-binding EF-hand superfamily protein